MRGWRHVTSCTRRRVTSQRRSVTSWRNICLPGCHGETVSRDQIVISTDAGRPGKNKKVCLSILGEPAL